MSRLSRAVFAGLPHHITQRGNRRDDVFFTDEDRLAYLGWWRGYCEKHDVDVLADSLLSDQGLVTTAAWADWLSVEEATGRLDMLRKHVEKGLPCGSESFVERLGNQIGRVLERRPQGRPRLEKEEKG